MSLYQWELDTYENYKLLLNVVLRKGRLFVNTGKERKGHPAWNKKYDRCQVGGCQRPHRAKGMCINHYSKFRK